MDRRIEALQGVLITVEEYLRTRLVELVVHTGAVPLPTPRALKCQIGLWDFRRGVSGNKNSNSVLTLSVLFLTSGWGVPQLNELRAR